VYRPSEAQLSASTQKPVTWLSEETEENSIIFHMVSHSHDDVGWNLTPEEYYAQKVHKILDSVVKALQAKKERKFSQTEVYYFERWWKDQTHETKAIVK